MTTRPQIAWLVAALMVVAACSDSDSDTAVTRAEAKVTAKERALSSAKSDAAAATEAFCGASKTYIVALDRYGDVLNATSPTVGDVTEAGAEVAQPGEEAAQAAEAAVEAQEQLLAAEQELTDARAALAEARASTSGPSDKTTSAEPESTTTPAPLAPAATVNRVEQAESDFAAAQKSITDQTPLVQASQQFNAAAVALEMSWLSLYADAGCLTDDQQVQAEAAVSAYTTTLQQALSEAGYYQAPADGIYGPQTVNAVEALQQAHGLPVTGTVDKATAAALESDLQAKGGAAADQATASTAAIQQTLHLAGLWDGPIDGTWTPELTEAVKTFQTELGVEPTGTVDAATVAALEQAIATAQQTEQTPATSGSTSGSATAPTATTPSSTTPT